VSCLTLRRRRTLNSASLISVSLIHGSTKCCWRACSTRKRINDWFSTRRPKELSCVEAFNQKGQFFHVEELRALKLLDHYKLHESGRSKLVVEFVEKADAAQGQEAAEMMKATPSSQLEASKGNYFRDS